MYESFFELTDRPFAAAPRVDRYYPGEAAEAARVALGRALERAEGYGLLVGPVGSGKTLLCHVLAEQFHQRLAPVLLSGTRIPSRKALLQAILYELGLPHRRREEGELRLALIDRLTSGREHPQGMLLLVDEAHTLPTKLVEELRLLTNVIRQGEPRVRLVLAGSPLLEERLAQPRLASLQQRVAVRCFLDPFSTAETCEFVRAQVAAAGGDPDAMWRDDALSAIHKATGGVPRLINQLCDHALLLAAAGAARQIDARRIEAAWADLQQLPMPAEIDRPAGSMPSENHSVVEFGALDDAGEVLAAVAPEEAGGDLAPELDEIDREFDLHRQLDDFQNERRPSIAIDVETDRTRRQPSGQAKKADDLISLKRVDPAETDETSQYDDPSHNDETSQYDETSSYVEEEVVLNAFAGLEAPTVRPMIQAPAPQAIGETRVAPRPQVEPQDSEQDMPSRAVAGTVVDRQDDPVLPDDAPIAAEFKPARHPARAAHSDEPAVLPLRPHRAAPLAAASIERVENPRGAMEDDAEEDIVYAEPVEARAPVEPQPAAGAANASPPASPPPPHRSRQFKNLFSRLRGD